MNRLNWNDDIERLPKFEMKALEDEQMFKEYIDIFEWFTQELNTLKV